MTEINWQDPPKKRGGGRVGSGAHADFADALRANPGRWALWREHAATSSATHVSQGVLINFRPAGSFETTVRNIQGNKGDVYVRYVGES